MKSFIQGIDGMSFNDDAIQVDKFVRWSFVRVTPNDLDLGDARTAAMM